MKNKIIKATVLSILLLTIIILTIYFNVTADWSMVGNHRIEKFDYNYYYETLKHINFVVIWDIITPIIVIVMSTLYIAYELNRKEKE